MSSPTHDLPDLQDYLVRKDRELHGRLKQLNEARKHLQGFAELEQSLVKKDHELQQQVAQLSEAGKHLKDTSTSNGREPIKSACPVNSLSTLDDRSGSPPIGTAAALREQLSQQPSHGHTPELVSQPEAGASRSLTDEVVTSRAPRPKTLEVPACAVCGQKTRRMPSAVGQLCSGCRHHITAQHNDFDQLDAENYPTIMWFNGAYREFWCFGCGGNVSDFDDGSRKRSRPPGQWWQGIRGLHSHIANKHHVNPADYGFNRSVMKMGWYEVAHVCVKKDLARILSEEDVERIENSNEPDVPIVMRVSFKKTFAQAEQEHRKKVNASPPLRSPGHTTATPAAEEAVNGSTQSYKHSHNYGTHTTALGTRKDAESESHYKFPYLSDHAAETVNKANGAREMFDCNSRGLKRSKGGGKVAENYAHESDEYDEDHTPIASKRRRGIDQTFTSDTES